jgi:RNA polymerase-binding transcription factor DksA
VNDETTSPEPSSLAAHVESAEPVRDDDLREEEMPVGLGVVTSVITEAESTLGDVEAALERLESGDYGTCEVCHGAIEPSILEHSPVARRCGTHASGENPQLNL